MNTSGTYSEDLPCGGTLKITKSHWEIGYYFPGPDMRHNGTFVNVPGERIDAYVDAFRENWEEYKQLKSSIPAGGTFSKEGRQGMMIHIGEYIDGVCIHSYHMRLATPEAINRTIKSYRYAQARAEEVQALLQQL